MKFVTWITCSLLYILYHHASVLIKQFIWRGDILSFIFICESFVLTETGNEMWHYLIYKIKYYTHHFARGLCRLLLLFLGFTSVLYFIAYFYNFLVSIHFNLAIFFWIIWFTMILIVLDKDILSWFNLSLKIIVKKRTFLYVIHSKSKKIIGNLICFKIETIY